MKLLTLTSPFFCVCLSLWIKITQEKVFHLKKTLRNGGKILIFILIGSEHDKDIQEEEEK